MIAVGLAGLAVLVGCQRAAAPDGGTAVRLDRVVDGDTVDVVVDGEVERVRLLGVDAPEAADRDDWVPAECGADAATAFVRDLAEGGDLTLVLDPGAGTSDRFGRILGYLDVDGTDLGLALVAAGLAEAWHPKSAPEPARFPGYLDAQTRARADRTGSWGVCPDIGR